MSAEFFRKYMDVLKETDSDSNGDPLQRGFNIVNKKPRAGQTDLSNIPAGNYPDTGRPFSDEDRARQPEILKKSLRTAQGKYGPDGILPENEQDL